MEAQFIDINYLKKNTSISGNVDPQELLPFITEAQDLHIQEILGSRLYNQLVEAVYNATYGSPVVPLTTAQTDLLNLIAPTLAYYTMYVALPFTMIKWKNKGLQKGANNETGNTSADLREMQYLRENVLNTAHFYADRVAKYLCNNNTLYPFYNSQGDKADIFPKSSNNFGFYLGNGNGLSQNEIDTLKKYIG